MPTPNDVIPRAFQLLGLIQPGESLSAEEQSDALATLNDMLHQWKQKGVDVEHVDLAATDDILLPPDHIKALRYNLAVELATEYGKQVPRAVASIASSSFQALRNQYIDPRILRTDGSISTRDDYVSPSIDVL